MAKHEITCKRSTQFPNDWLKIWVSKNMWPESLIREIIEKRCVIHVGSGMSCQSMGEDGNRPPSWKGLLETLRDKSQLAREHIELVNQFIAENKLLDAAEIIRLKGRAAEVSGEIKKKFIDSKLSPADVHKQLVEIAPKIVITTNYDTLIENALVSAGGIDSFTQFEFSRDGLLDAIRSPATILIKLHGCGKYPASTILSRSDYFKLRKSHTSFFDIITAIYKLNTVLFLGCGIEDPDINLILENNTIQTDSSNPSYALVGSLSYAAKLKDTIRSQYNIDIITYEQNNPNDHSGFSSAIKDLHEQVLTLRAKYQL
ncbi:TPA: SIR2 family NAD-dependent protein deacylase [Pseudomonas aeruginosa]